MPFFACLVMYVFIYLFTYRQCSKFVKGGNFIACSQLVAPAVLHSPHKATEPFTLNLDGFNQFPSHLERGYLIIFGIVEMWSNLN